VDGSDLQQALTDAFEGELATALVVARQARDLADSGRFAESFGRELTVDTVISNLEDAPEEFTLVERWNWWVGSMELSHGGYEQFRIREGAVR
jgi:hypothetical protein